jgi:adenylate cyclase
MTTTRRLAAILAADVAGYSAMMERDEEGTFARVRALRREVIEPKLAEHQGRLIKTTGDGFLAEFASPIAALKCAIAIQTKMTEGDPLQLRIGLNLGDVIIEDGDVYGEGVNVSSRLEALAAPGGILVSDKIHREVDGKVEATFEDRGEQQVKNISKPVRAYAVLTEAALSGSSSSIEPKRLPLPDKPSIAVLPFQNMSGDPEQEYFADGMVEEIITALSRFKSLFVIARNSSFTYKNKVVDVKQVGRDLGVRYVIEGSVRKAGGRVRITGQLIDAISGAHLWADKFDGALDDIFDLQDRVSSSVVGAIFPKLQLSEFERAKQKLTNNLTAYDYHLRGLARMYQFRKETFEEALPLFNRAMEADPEFASPYAAAAFWYALRQTFGWTTDRDQSSLNSLALARRALELEDDDAIVLTYAGFMLGFWSDDVEAAAARLERATSVNPNLALAWNYLGWVNTYLGNHADAIEQLEKALRLSPLDPLAFTTETGLGYANFFIGRAGEALKWANTALRGRPEFLPAHRLVMACHSVAGEIELAKTVWVSLRQKDPAQNISKLMHGIPFQRDEDRKNLADCYRLAGVPE